MLRQQRRDQACSQILVMGGANPGVWGRNPQPPKAGGLGTKPPSRRGQGGLGAEPQCSAIFTIFQQK